MVMVMRAPLNGGDFERCLGAQVSSVFFYECNLFMKILFFKFCQPFNGTGFPIIRGAESLTVWIFEAFHLTCHEGAKKERPASVLSEKFFFP